MEKAKVLKKEGHKKGTANAFEVELNPEAPLFVIGVVSELTAIPIWTLRKLDEMDVVKPKRLGKKIRCYSHTQIKKITYVHYLMEEKGVSISSVKVVMEFSETREGNDIRHA